jgi:ribosomal protein L29
MDIVTHANKPIREMTDAEIAARLAELEAEIKERLTLLREMQRRRALRANFTEGF